MNGPGKYDNVCTIARKITHAELVALIVVGGVSGDGFAVQCTDKSLLQHMPNMLRHMADQIEGAPNETPTKNQQEHGGDPVAKPAAVPDPTGWPEAGEVQ